MAAELGAVPEARLRERFEGRAEAFRRSAAGLLHGDEAILAHPRAHFGRLREFYRCAAECGACILLTLV